MDDIFYKNSWNVKKNLNKHFYSKFGEAKKSKKSFTYPRGLL